MRPFRLCWMPPLLLAGACASSGSSPAPASTTVQTTMPIIGGGGNNSTLSTTTTTITAATARFPYSADLVFGVLPSVYEELKIPVTTMVSTEHMLGNVDFRGRRAIGALPMRHLIDCGGTTGEPNADTFEIFLSVSSEVKPDGPNEAVLATVLQASGRSIAFSGNDVRCSSTGELETKIATLTKQKLAALR